MRIIQILPELNLGGVERGSVELAKELVKNGHESIVISNGGKLVLNLENEGSKHYKFDVCSKNILTFFWRIRKLKKLLKQINPDVIHIRSRVPAWLVYFANKELKIPTVATVHGFNSVNFYSKIMTKFDCTICVSNAIKEYLIKNYSINEKDLKVIARGVNLDEFSPDKLDFEFIKTYKNSFDINDKFIIGLVGRITQLKDIESFIKAIALLKTDFNEVVGLIVGDARQDKMEYLNSLKELVKSLNLEKNIIFAGSTSKIAEIYQICDVLVSSSKKPESFGRSVAEALSIGTPVVASNHGGVKDIIKDGVNGYFFEVGNEKELSERIKLAKELKFDGFGYIKENFSLENMANNTMKIYESLV
ncbi:glycosyltransferase family 4 protein [Campylobacter geochelonis]|uniref:Glycosyltransferase n=1 Tax=Campylobacter geochelonis TaxID=1780362 RepID=A0A128EL50_9BACT|nr:glycosyltransferase family 4 protein [Campylobacter geochelonis]QKF71548.1 glycosyltransferase, family 1 [Campylobacter geochelonis]CZE48775.1 glycosyltransferase [Campylobacter geochelonis]CZE49088.1 glycosyltransferase [Campylobacter geochelonis]CZE51352.1 glycosyltransferase [Campylobacter geochelonis]